MAKFRGITWNNSRFGAKIIVRRSIDIAEMGDFGSITSDADDLPTRGAVHRGDKSGSTSGTRNYLDLRGIAGQYSNVVDTQDMGLISDTASTHRVWSSSGAISDIVTSAPTTLGNPSGSGSGSSSSGTTLTGGEAFATGWAWTYWATASDSTTSNPQVQIRVNHTTIDSDWETALDNWSTGDSIEVVTPTSLAGTTLTASGTGITTSTSGNYTTYYFDVSTAPSSSTYLYKVEHTTSGSSSGSSSTTSTQSPSATATWRAWRDIDQVRPTKTTLFDFDAEFSSQSNLYDEQLSYTKTFNVSPDGTKFWMSAGDTSQTDLTYTVQEYTTSTAWDFSSGSLSLNKTYTQTAQSSGPMLPRMDWAHYEWNNDGTKIYMEIGNHIHEYSVSTAYDFDTISSTANAELDDYAYTSWQFGDDGEKLFAIVGRDMYVYDLSTAYDISTASLDTSQTTRVGYATNAKVYFSFDSIGKNLYVVDYRPGSSGSQPVKLYQMTLSTAWDLTTIEQTAYNDVWELLGNTSTANDDYEIRTAHGLRLSSDDGTLFILGSKWRHGETDGYTPTLYSLQLQAIPQSETADEGALFTTEGLTKWTVPANVTSISVVTIGGGQGGYRMWNNDANRVTKSLGGMGGSLRYVNNISVTPGDELDIYVGEAGNSISTTGSYSSNTYGSSRQGGESWIKTSSGTVLALAHGGNAGVYSGTSTEVGSGGDGGSGGSAGSAMYGGAGGGGAGGYYDATESFNGTSGNGGGPGSSTSKTAYGGAGNGGQGGYSKSTAGKRGGGVGIYGLTATTTQTVLGGGGSGGQSGNEGGAYGGGGGGGAQSVSTSGGPGGVRIVWQTNAAFPSTNVSDSGSEKEI